METYDDSTTHSDMGDGYGDDFDPSLGDTSELARKDIHNGPAWNPPIVVKKITDIDEALVAQGYTVEHAAEMRGRRYDAPDLKTGRRMFYEGIGFALQQNGCAICMDGTQDPIVFWSLAYEHASKHRPKPERNHAGRR